MKALQPKLRNKMSAPGFGRRSLHRADQGVHQSASPESGVYSSCDIVSINITLSSKNNFGHLKRATWRNAVSSLAGSRLEFSRHLQRSRSRGLYARGQAQSKNSSGGT